MRQLLLLPLLLLAACKPAEPAEPTPQQVGDVLAQQALELVCEAEALLINAAASGDVCAKAETINAGLEMAAAQYDAIAVLQEENGEVTNAMRMKGVANGHRKNARRLRRECG